MALLLLETLLVSFHLRLSFTCTDSTKVALTTKASALGAAIASLQLNNGGDAANAQLEALLQVAKRNSEVGWSASSRRVILMVTQTPYHDPVNDNKLSPNDLDGYH